MGSLEAWGRYTHTLTLQAGEGAVSAGLAVRLGAPPPARLRPRASATASGGAYSFCLWCERCHVTTVPERAA